MRSRSLRAVSAPVTTATITPRQRASTTRTPATSRIERLDPALDALLDQNAHVEKLAEGFAWTEGPVWRRDKGYLLFSDIPHNTVWKWNEARGALDLHASRGLRVRHRIRRAVSSAPTGSRSTRTARSSSPTTAIAASRGWNDSLFTRTVVVDRFEGKRFNSPNDLVWAPNGDLYFTDPSYGLRGLNDDPAKELPFNGVFRALGERTAQRRDARSHLPER